MEQRSENKEIVIYTPLREVIDDLLKEYHSPRPHNPEAYKNLIAISEALVGSDIQVPEDKLRTIREIISKDIPVQQAVDEIRSYLN